MSNLQQLEDRVAALEKEKTEELKNRLQSNDAAAAAASKEAEVKKS